MSWKFGFRYEKNPDVVYLEKIDLDANEKGPTTTVVAKFYIEREPNTDNTHNINLIFDNTNLTNIYNLINKIDIFMAMMFQMFSPTCCPITLSINAETFEINKLYFKNQEINISNWMLGQQYERTDMDDLCMGNAEYQERADDFGNLISVIQNMVIKDSTVAKENIDVSETIIADNPNMGFFDKLKSIWAVSSDNGDENEDEESLDDFLEKQIIEKSESTPITDDNSFTQSFCLDSCTNEYSQSKLFSMSDNSQTIPLDLIQKFALDTKPNVGSDEKDCDTNSDTDTDSNTDPNPDPGTNTNLFKTNTLDQSEIMGCIKLQNCSKPTFDALKFFIKTKFSYEYYEYLIEQFVGLNTTSLNVPFSPIVEICSIRMSNVPKQIKVDNDTLKYVEYKYNETDEKTHVFKYQHFVELIDVCTSLIDILSDHCV